MVTSKQAKQEFDSRPKVEISVLCRNRIVAETEIMAEIPTFGQKWVHATFGFGGHC
jgi:hypothetical protein